MVSYYVDSSVVLRKLFGQTDSLKLKLHRASAISSELLLVECHRVIDRHRLQSIIDDQEVVLLTEQLRRFVRGVELYPISLPVINRARDPFPAIIGTLDSLHLSTALLWQKSNNQDLIMLTHDKQLGTVARACGLTVQGASL